VYKHLYLRRF